MNSSVHEQVQCCQTTKWIVPQIFKLLPKRHIFFDLVIRFITQDHMLSADNVILNHWIKVDHVQL